MRCGAVAVIVRDDRLLVILGAATVEVPGTYCFPGGVRLEAGETEEEAIRRELREERRGRRSRPTHLAELSRRGRSTCAGGSSTSTRPPRYSPIRRKSSSAHWLTRA